MGAIDTCMAALRCVYNCVRKCHQRADFLFRLFYLAGPALSEMKQKVMKRPVENYIVELNKGSVDLTILRNPRARRMTLRVDPKPVSYTHLTLPTIYSV